MSDLDVTAVRRPEEPTGRFGTFGGVFTPSILTILGVILYMRSGFVVGQAGIAGAAAILVISEIIVLFTALSVAGIATNTRVRGGGAYYLISRVLGPEFGGAIGLTLFSAQALSVPFYVLGFTEALVGTVGPELAPYGLFIALATTVGLFLVNLIGTGWAIKSQYLIMLVLGASLVAILGGAAVRFDTSTFVANLRPLYTSPEFHFWSVFAVYFPAVTGIMAGVNMSGDLRDPGRSLVRGTFAAIAVGGLVYLASILLCGGSQSRTDLVEAPYGTLLENALAGAWHLVAAGVFAATLSSSVGSFLGAPRILQALAHDRIFPLFNLFSTGSGRAREPRRALILTLAIAVAVIVPASGQGAQGAFNVVASIVTMFFLLTYGIVNLAAFVESFGSNPSFRPRFALFHWSTALAGALACLAVMVLIDVVAAVIATAIMAALYLYTSRRAVESNFGDARRGFVYARAARNLQRLRDMPIHPKNWRPSILVLSGSPERRLTVARFGSWLEGGRGIVSLVQFIRGRLDELNDRRLGALATLRDFMREHDLDIMPEVVVAESFDEGLRVAVQAHSLDPIKPNLVVMGWPREESRLLPFARHLSDIRLLEKSVVVVIDRGLPDPSAPKRVDLWWRGKENGSLMIILAHLLTENWEWGNSEIRLLRLVENEAGRVPARVALANLAHEARIDAEAVVVVSKEPFQNSFYKHSQGASVVFLGFQVPTQDEFPAFHSRMGELTAGLPTTVLVSSNGDADLFA